MKTEGKRKVFHTFEVVSPLVYIKVPEVLYDIELVYSSLNKDEQKRTSIENVRDVLDAVIRLMHTTPDIREVGCSATN